MSSIGSKVKTNLGVIIAAGLIIGSLVKVFSTEKENILAGKNTLAISHWQLEDGYREGLQQVIDNFIAMKKKQGQKVNIIQTVVPWRGYRQWSTTQLVGGKPVDIMEMIGLSASYTSKYFYRLDQYVNVVNPYNKGTPLEGLPWKQTFIDGMRSAWDGRLMGYYEVGTAAFTWRIYYNMDLLEKITGSSDPPATFEDWLKQCREIVEYANREKKVIVPIVVRGFDGSTVKTLYLRFSGSFYYSLLDKIDLNMDGEADFLEIYYAKTKGVFSWDDPEIKAPIMMLRDLSRYFQKGFTSVDLEQAKFLFLQSRAVYLPEGSWQSRSMFANAPFRLGVFEIPPPAPDSPYRKFYDGHLTEVNQGAGAKYAITRKCRNFELALDFLMFMTSYEQNTLWNESAAWIPAVRFAKMSPILEKFKPDMTGIPNISGDTGFFAYFGRTRGDFLQALSSYLVEQANSPKEDKALYARFMKEVNHSYKMWAKQDTEEYLEEQLRSITLREYQMSWLEVIGEYLKDDPSRAVGLPEKKKMVMESIIQAEEKYNLDRKLFQESFK